jgi:Holliday junction resolvase
VSISKQNAKRAGKRFEWSVRDDLTGNGYKVIVSAGSLTPCDMVAVKPGQVLFVQCKAGTAGGGTPGLLRVAERRGLLEFAYHLNACRHGLGIGVAVVAHQVREGRRHVLAYRELTGAEPGASRPWTPDEVPASQGAAAKPCGDFVADGHSVYDPRCGACREANSDAPEWTI